MTSPHILVAEDDLNIRHGLVDTLESEGYSVTAAGDGGEALEIFFRQSCDLVILDIMMPVKSGYDVCRRIRQENRQVPIIMLTAKGEEIDKVVGLQLGADDYVTKPFGVHELLARIAAVLRRSRRQSAASPGKEKAPRRFRFGGAEIDGRQLRGRKDGSVFDLTTRELDLLIYFHRYPNEVLSRERLLNAVWGLEYYGTTRTLDQHIAQLRKKIEPRGTNPRYITTVHGVGYRYTPPE